MVSALGRSEGTPASDRGLTRSPGRGTPRPETGALASEQLGLFGVPHPVVEQLRTVDINNMTPLQALEQLARLVDAARSGPK